MQLVQVAFGFKPTFSDIYPKEYNGVGFEYTS